MNLHRTVSATIWSKILNLQNDLDSTVIFQRVTFKEGSVIVYLLLHISFQSSFLFNNNLNYIYICQDTHYSVHHWKQNNWRKYKCVHLDVWRFIWHTLVWKVSPGFTGNTVLPISSTVLFISLAICGTANKQFELKKSTFLTYQSTV